MEYLEIIEKIEKLQKEIDDKEVERNKLADELAIRDFLSEKEEKNTMKKLFVSVPMKGRTEEEIKASIQKMKKIAEIYEGEELELIDSYIEDNPPKDSKEAVWYLGESVKKLAQADVFIGINDAWDWSGCYIEIETAKRYDIKAYMIPANYVIDDYNALLQKLHPICCDAMPRVLV